MKRFLTFVAIFILFQSYIIAQDWELIRNEKGIEVHYKEADSKGIIKVKMTQTLETNLSTIAAVLTDFDNYENWKEACESSELIKTVNTQEFVYYYKTDLPWPINDRDCVLKFKISQDSTTKVVNAKATCVTGYVDLDDDYERDYDNVNVWTLTPVGTTKVKIYNYLEFKVIDGLPQWLVEQGVDSGPFNTMLNLQSQVKLTKYKNKTVSYIKN